jgi:CcmD family protein
MLTSILQGAPAETTNYMIAGYVVIFGIMFLYVFSLVLRTRRLKQELQMIEELEPREE